MFVHEAAASASATFVNYVARSLLVATMFG